MALIRNGRDIEGDVAEKPGMFVALCRRYDLQILSVRSLPQSNSCVQAM
jgi:hypothetical protein